MIIIFINIIMIISMNKIIHCVLMGWLKKVEILFYDNYHDDNWSLFRQTIQAWIMFI